MESDRKVVCKHKYLTATFLISMDNCLIESFQVKYKEDNNKSHVRIPNDYFIHFTFDDISMLLNQHH